MHSSIFYPIDLQKISVIVETRRFLRVFALFEEQSIKPPWQL